MRNFPIVACLLFSFAAFGQDDFERVLMTNPFMTNGFFIVDDAKRQQLGATNVEVEIIVDKPQADGTILHTTIQTLTITPSTYYARADLSLIGQLAIGESVYYHLTATNNNDDVLLEFVHRTEDGNEGEHEICRVSCEGPSYAWALVASSDQQELHTWIRLVEATQNSSYYYFYVKSALWQAFTMQFPPSAFGIPLDWGVLDQDQYDEYVLSFENAPEYARDYQGIPFGDGYNGPCKAVRKDKGPWRGLNAVTEDLAGGPSDYCIDNVLMAHYNSDDNVQYAMIDGDFDPLACEALFSTGGGESWGDGGWPWCTEITYSDGTGDIDVVGWVMETIACPNTYEAAYPPGLSAVSSIVIQHWAPMNPSPAITIPIPDGNDPRLVHVERSELAAGLYEFTIVFDNGRLIRQFQDFPQAVSVSADFAAFTEVSVYPVPVTGTTFAVDLDILTPMSIGLTIVNNQGTVYYTKSLNFGLAGLNKHVVRMNTQWPQGIYHCVFQYPDGSGESLSISVE